MPFTKNFTLWTVALASVISLGASLSHADLAAKSLLVESVVGASAAQLSNAKTMVTILGGLAGGDCSVLADGRKTCDSCSSRVTSCGANQPFCSCNTTRIYNNLVVRINLKKTAKSAGNALALVMTSTHSFYLLPVTANNGAEFIDFTWTSLCAALGNSDCNTLESVAVNTLSMRIGQDLNRNGRLEAGEPTVNATFKLIRPANYDVYGQPNRDGFSGFQAFAGESKVFIENVTAAKAFPMLAYGARAQAMRVFASEEDMDHANYDSAVKTLEMTLDGSGRAFTVNEIKGLVNGTLYFFRAATVDEAGNLVQFLPNPRDLPQSCVTSPSDHCPYAATPAISIPTPFIP